MHLYFRFCDPAPHVIAATNTTPIHITTLEPHNLANNAIVMVRGVGGNLAANAPQAQAHVTGPNTFDLFDFTGANPIAGNGACVSATPAQRASWISWRRVAMLARATARSLVKCCGWGSSFR